MANPIVEKAKERMTQSHQSLGREFGSIRAGRANASLLDRIFVEYYGVETPLNQLASITIPEARVLLITPFDKSSLKDIEHSINASDLGITPANDGSVIRLVIPALTEETRRDLAKEVNGKGYHYSEMVNPEACIGCASCALVCPDSVITVYKMNVQ